MKREYTETKNDFEITAIAIFQDPLKPLDTVGIAITLNQGEGRVQTIKLDEQSFRALVTAVGRVLPRRRRPLSRPYGIDPDFGMSTDDALALADMADIPIPE